MCFYLFFLFPDTDYPDVLTKYELLNKFNGRYALEFFDADNSVKLILNNLPDTDTEIIMIKAVEENVIPEKFATLPIVINLVHEFKPLITTTPTIPTTTSTTPTTTQPTSTSTTTPTTPPTPTTTPTTPPTTTSITSTPTISTTTTSIPTSTSTPSSTSTTSPNPCTSRFDQTVYDDDSFAILEGSEEESNDFVNCGTKVHSVSSCSDQISIEYSVISISPPMFENYIKLDKTSGMYILHY